SGLNHWFAFKSRDGCWKILTVGAAHYEHSTSAEHEHQQPKQIARDSVRRNQAPLWTHGNLTSKIVNQSVPLGLPTCVIIPIAKLTNFGRAPQPQFASGTMHLSECR